MTMLRARNATGRGWLTAALGCSLGIAANAVPLVPKEIPLTPALSPRRGWTICHRSRFPRQLIADYGADSEPSLTLTESVDERA
jgi:hypothetical protein